MTKNKNFGKALFKNTISNYTATGVRFLSSFFLTYLLFTGLSKEFYGFWALLWSVFVYSLLLDLGFGKAVEKYTAEASFTGNIKKYNDIISTIFFSYCVIAFIIFLAGYILSLNIEKLFTFVNSGKTAEVEYYRQVFLLFTLGVSIVFPTGAFPTILIGLQKTYLRNYVIIANKLIEVFGVWYLLSNKHSLIELVIFTASINLLSNIVMGIMAFRLMPGLSISMKNFKFSTMKYIADFSFFTYIIAICDLIIFQTDRIVLATCLGMSSIAIYQVAIKIPQLIGITSTQFQSNLAPVATILHKAQDKERLQQALFTSTRITVYICTGVFTVFIPLVRPILHVWLKVDDATTIQVAYILIVSTFMLIVFKDTAKHFLLMTGHHRFLTYTIVAEAISNLGLSIILVKTYGVVGVAWGTLIPNAFIGLFVIFPAAARYSGNSIISYLFKVYLPILLISVPICFIAGFFTHHVALLDWNLYYLLIFAAVTGTLYVLTGWLLYITREEKIKLCGYLPKFIPEYVIKIIIGPQKGFKR